MLLWLPQGPCSPLDRGRGAKAARHPGLRRSRLGARTELWQLLGHWDNYKENMLLTAPAERERGRTASTP